jgi:hypothetical protein
MTGADQSMQNGWLLGSIWSTNWAEAFPSYSSSFQLVPFLHISGDGLNLQSFLFRKALRPRWQRGASPVHTNHRVVPH